ncbi:hypothetical protein F4779DRAFT_615423 [Xylariaceae sp. FL0662B]|nr:hypothetical protein F4779DRAFT_615423 [Xylariaceae sp. FL0662B]
MAPNEAPMAKLVKKHINRMFHNAGRPIEDATQSRRTSSNIAANDQTIWPPDADRIHHGRHVSKHDMIGPLKGNPVLQIYYASVDEKDYMEGVSQFELRLANRHKQRKGDDHEVQD